MASGSHWPLELKLFGPAELAVRGVRSSFFPHTGKGKLDLRLLAWFVLHRHQAFERELLAQIVFPYSHDPRQTVREALSQLRHSLGPEASRVAQYEDPVSIPLDDAKVDLFDFDEAVRSSSPEDWKRAVAMRKRGRLFADLKNLRELDEVEGEWLKAAIDSREELYRERLRALAERARQSNEPTVAQEYLHLILNSDPIDVAAAHDLMALLADEGNGKEIQTVGRKLRRAMGKDWRNSEIARFYTQERQRAAAVRELLDRPLPSLDVDNQPEADTAALLADIGRRGGAVMPASDAAPISDLGIKREAHALRTLFAPLGYHGILPLPLTSIIGREQEIQRLQSLLLQSTSRLITLTGTAGVGKTRLALEVAQQLYTNFQGAVWFIPLQEATDPSQIENKIWGTLSATLSGPAAAPSSTPLKERIGSILSAQRSLLILDTFEHLLPNGAREVQELLERMELLPLQVIVTSRHQLGLLGEQVFSVEPLSVPTGYEAVEALSPHQHPKPLDQTRLADLSASPSVQLFVDRVQAKQSDFQITPANGATLARLCERLEGNPLGLEIAAGWTRVLTLRQMLQRMNERLQWQSRERRDHERHGSLRAAIDWSYDLLPPELQRFFLQLSVFRGGYTAEAAEGVCEERRALQFLGELLERSLIKAWEEGASKRFTMLDTLREYALQRLPVEVQGALAERHLTFYSEFAEQAGSGILSADQAHWLGEVETEHDNLRAALDRIVASPGDTERGLRMGTALWQFWWHRGYLSEGQTRLEQLVEKSASMPTVARGEALNAAGNLARFQGDYQRAEALYRESIAVCKAIDYPPGIAAALANLGRMARRRGDLPGAERYLEEALAICHAHNRERGIADILADLGNVALWQEDVPKALARFEESLIRQRKLRIPARIADALTYLGNALLAAGEIERAQQCIEDSLAIHREGQDAQGIAIAIAELGRIAQAQGEAELALARYHEALPLLFQVGDQVNGIECLEHLAQIALGRGDFEQATCLWAAATKLREAMQTTLPPAERAQRDQEIAVLQARLDEATFGKVWAHGRSMTFSQAVRYAQGQLELPTP